MTQLKNQDPTSPMDTNTFTSELVQFASVEQQISTNTNLSTLISLAQSNATLQSAAIVGKQATYTSSTVQLSNGTATVGFDLTSAENVRIAITNSSGTSLVDTTVSGSAGSNVWTWNGKDASGNTVSDGSYTISVTPASGTDTTAISTYMSGTVSAVSSGSTTPTLLIGNAQVSLSEVTSISD
jgi:flagellar basal-body rod modification protein FlgD